MTDLQSSYPKTTETQSKETGKKDFLEKCFETINAATHRFLISSFGRSQESHHL